MRDTESEPDYTQLHVSHFDTPMEYSNPEVHQGLPSPTPLSPCPTTSNKKVNRPFSGKNPALSCSARVDKKPQVNVELNIIGKLTVQENYQIWCASLTIILKGIEADEIVVN